MGQVWYAENGAWRCYADGLETPEGECRMSSVRLGNCTRFCWDTKTVGLAVKSASALLSRASRGGRTAECMVASRLMCKTCYDAQSTQDHREVIHILIKYYLDAPLHRLPSRPCSLLRALQLLPTRGRSATISPCIHAWIFIDLTLHYFSYHETLTEDAHTVHMPLLGTNLRGGQPARSGHQQNCGMGSSKSDHAPSHLTTCRYQGTSTAL